MQEVTQIGNMQNRPGIRILCIWNYLHKPAQL